MNKWVVAGSVVVILAIMALLAVMFRYQTTSAGPIAYQTDRWTGRTWVLRVDKREELQTKEPQRTYTVEEMNQIIRENEQKKASQANRFATPDMQAKPNVFDQFDEKTEKKAKIEVSLEEALGEKKQ